MSLQEREAIFAAIRAGDIAALGRLAEAGVDVRADADPDELSALHFAAACGHLEVVAFLLRPPWSMPPSLTRQNRFTPLHAAAMQGHAAVVKMLLEAGADPDIQTEPQGYAPLHSAAWGGHLDAVHCLVQHGAALDRQNYRRETPLQTAQRQGQDAVAHYLQQAAISH